MRVRDVIETIEEYSSQKELAKKMGVAPRTIRKWKTGKRKPTPEHTEKLRRIRGGYRGMGTKKPIHRRRRVTRDLYGKRVLAQRSASEGVLVGTATLHETEQFLHDIEGILRAKFFGDAYPFFKSIHKWMLSGNLSSGVQIGVIFDMRYQDKGMDEMVYRKEQFMFTRSAIISEEPVFDVLDGLIGNLIDNFYKWVNQSPLDFLELYFKMWHIISYRYRDF